MESQMVYHLSVYTIGRTDSDNGTKQRKARPIHATRRVPETAFPSSPTPDTGTLPKPTASNARRKNKQGISQQLGEARFPSIGSRLSVIWATVNRLSRFCGREAHAQTVNCPPF